MAKKFERMENVLLMEAKEVKGIKDRINEIDDNIAKNNTNKNIESVDTSPVEEANKEVDNI
jgi:hypothetical protein